LQFASMISFQVFQAFVRSPEFAPNDHRRGHHSQWQEIGGEYRQRHVPATSEIPLLPESDPRLSRPHLCAATVPSICAPRAITRDVQWSSPSIWPLTSTKPSAVTLPTIFSPLAITVPRCLDANMVPSYPVRVRTYLSTGRLREGFYEAIPSFALFRGFWPIVV